MEDIKFKKTSLEMGDNSRGCPECHSEFIISDSHRGETICSNCGLVIDDHIPDTQRNDRRAFTQEEKEKRERTGSPISILLPDMGLSTIIDPKAKMSQTMKRVILPTASSGITASIILAMGRAIGETMAVVLVLGNVEMIPKSILNPAEALTSVILLEMGEAPVGGSHYQALFAVGIILFIIVMILNIISMKIGVREK